MELLGNGNTATTPRFTGRPDFFLPTLMTQDPHRGGPDFRSAPGTFRRPWATLPPANTNAKKQITYYHSGRVTDAGGLFGARSLSGGLESSPSYGGATSTRFTPNDWMASNQVHYMSSDRVRDSSERLRLDVKRLCQEADDRTRRTQDEVGRRLVDRIGDVDWWKSEVVNERDCMRTEIESLADAKACLERALAETEKPLYIAQECLFNREKRQGVDLVHDEVEKELTREVDNINRCQNELRGLIASAANQLSLNRSAQNELEKDSCDKGKALSLDGICRRLRNASGGLQNHTGIEKVDKSNSVPQTWVQFTRDNIVRSQNARGASRDLRCGIEQLLNGVSTAIMNQWNACNTAITERTRQYMDTRNKLQTHLAKVSQEIYDLDHSIELLKRCIQEKGSPLQLAQTRLMTRVQRPNVERCRDQVHHRLVEEVYQIGETVDGLKAKLRESENTLENLVRTRASLEQDLNIKNNSLFIDKDTCLGMRKGLPMLPRMALY